MITENEILDMNLSQIEYYIHQHPEDAVLVSKVLYKVSLRCEKNYIKAKIKGEK